jgi:hypothetical protein|tara:strand:- start:543 stop:1238 length:696 start_codon:yes stop_codon:yes gene_type:complete
MSRRSEYDSYTDYEPPFKVSFDGKSYDYRDPDNQAMIDEQVRGDDAYDGVSRDKIKNQHSYNLFDPLYAFGEGEINMAGQALGIKNIDDPEEVDRMLEYLYKPKSFAEEAKEEQAEEALSTTPLSDELAQKGAPLSEDLQADVDFVKEQTQALRDGTFNDSYRRMGSGGPAIGTAASDALRAQMSTGTGDIDVNAFAKERAIRSMALGDEYSRSMGKNIFDDNSFRNSIFG